MNLAEERFETWAAEWRVGLIWIIDPALLVWFGWSYPPPPRVGAALGLWARWARMLR